MRPSSFIGLLSVALVAVVALAAGPAEAGTACGAVVAIWLTGLIK